jgi:hypothetical protein
MHTNNLIQDNRWFLVPYAILFMAGIIFYGFYSKPEVHIIINNWNSNISDFFFKYYTHLGDGLVVVIFFFTLLFVKFRHAIAFLAAGMTASIIVNLLKMFSDLQNISNYLRIINYILLKG